ncbi:MAG: hypothetical protein AB7O97_20810 [Planctomycetota bacterium]
MESTRLAVRRYRPGDEERILAAVDRTNGDRGPTAPARDLRHWHWQVRDNPAGHQVFLAVDARGTVAARCAALPRLADSPWGLMRFVHLLDSWTNPAYRAQLHGDGVLAELERAFAADYGAHGSELGYAFQAAGAGAGPADLLRGQVLDPLEFLLRPSAAGPLSPPTGVEVDRLLVLPEQVDSLWRRCRPTVPCSVRRDHRYLHWRYERIPSRSDYEFHAAYRQGRMTGLLVLRPFHDLVPGACAIADWICADEDEDSADALLACAADRARACQRHYLLAACAPTSPEWSRALAAGFAATPSARWRARDITLRITGPHLTPAFLRAHWRWTLGDSDLV